MRSGDTLASILWTAAERAPRRPAALQSGHLLDFSELAAQSRRLVGALAALGVRRGDPVALVLENGLGFLAAHYALATIGALIVPLNHHFRGGPLLDALLMCEARWLISCSGLLEALRSMPARPEPLRGGLLLDGGLAAGPLRMARTGPQLEAGPQEPVSGLPEPVVGEGPSTDDEAVLFLTSGTTGRPKGIKLTNRQALFGIDAWTSRWGYGPRTLSLMVAPFFHVVYNPLVLGAHRHAGGAVILNNLQARAATREVETSRANAIMGTPFFYMQLLNDRASLGRDLSSIDTLIYGAAPSPVPVIRTLQRRFPGARLYDCYGLTETGSAVSCLDSSELAGHEGSVGRAHPGVELSIRGEDMRELAAGEVGEVCCRGPNVIRSYYKAPEANAARFHGDWLRTGDMGYLDPAGYLFLLGRCDDLINVAGEKAYPSSIENVLYQHPQVLDAAVSVVADPAKGQLVKAVVVPRSGTGLDVRELRRFCLAQLPAVFVPRIFEFVAALPRNPSGKVLRREIFAAARPEPS